MFQQKFKFSPQHAYKFGIEREFFLANAYGQIVPRAQIVYEALHSQWGELFTYELSACQIESRSEIVAPESLGQHLSDCEDRLDSVLHRLNLQKLYLEVAPDTMPLDVFPDPSGRYAKLKEQMSRETLLAACQVAGTHVHVGMPDHETALRVYNFVIQYCDELCMVGDGSSGRRLSIYKKVAQNCHPLPYENWAHFHSVAVREGFAEEPRNCWTLIRITKHGTIEFRMFGVTESIPRLVEWALRCRNLCLSALQSVG